ALIGAQIVRQWGDKSPQLRPYLGALLLLYFAFVLLSWLSPSLFNLLLRLDRFGRHVLSLDELRGANVLIVCIVATLGCLAAAIATGNAILDYGTAMFILLALPASA